MPTKKPIEDVLFVRGIGAHAEAINAIAKKHFVPPQELARGLIGGAAQFYRRYGYFTFPAVVCSLPPPMRIPTVAAVLTHADALERANKIPVPDPALAKFSTVDLLHEIARRELAYDPPREEADFTLNEMTNGGLAAFEGFSAEQKNTPQTPPPTSPQSKPTRGGKRGSGQGRDSEK